MTKQLHPQFRSSPTEAPRQILCSLVIFITILYLAAQPGVATRNESIHKAALAVFISFLGFSFLQTRDLILTWPHPGLWRMVFGACSFYTFLLVTLLMLTKEEARSCLHFLFPGIGTQEEFDSGLRLRIDAVMGTCQLSTAALYRQLFHCPWFLAHAVGWSVKMLIFRDYFLAFFAAILFEIMEVTLMHVVPEFEECWWDSLFLDNLGANLLGMFLGSTLNKWIVARRKQAEREKSYAEKEQVEVSKIELGEEFNWVGRDWKLFSSPKRMLQVSIAAVFMSLSELNSFLLINAFGIANNNSGCVLFRLTFVGLIAIPAGAEWYAYIEECDHRGKHAIVRLGPSLWLIFWTTLLEITVAVKHFPSHMWVEIEKTGNITGIPYNVLLPLLTSFTLILLWVMLRYNVLAVLLGKERKEKQSSIQILDGLIALSLIPIAHIFQMGWKWD